MIVMTVEGTRSLLLVHPVVQPVIYTVVHTVVHPVVKKKIVLFLNYDVYKEVIQRRLKHPVAARRRLEKEECHLLLLLLL
jgi:hypothetical protein